MQVSSGNAQGFNIGQLLAGSSGREAFLAPAGNDSGAASFSSSMRLRVAEFRSQSVTVLLGSDDFALATPNARGSKDKGGGDIWSMLGTPPGATSATGTELTGAPAAKSGAGGEFGHLSATGRNPGLFDPESAYRMMTVIAEKDVLYKAQFAELSEMKSELEEMEGHGVGLEQLDEMLDGPAIRQRLAEFVAEYNEWTQRFDADMEQGGILAATQAAQVSRYELKQSIESPFFGAYQGFRGLGELGVTIDPVSKLASLDETRLDAAVAKSRQGVIDTLQEFGHNFAKSADLLNSDGNFIPNRLSNLDRVIAYIKDNKAALQTEFGLGDPAKPRPDVAAALAAYQQKYA